MQSWLSLWVAGTRLGRKLWWQAAAIASRQTGQYLEGFQDRQDDDGKEEEHRNLIEEAIKHMPVPVAVIVNLGDIAATLEMVNNQKGHSPQFYPEPCRGQLVLGVHPHHGQAEPDRQHHKWGDKPIELACHDGQLSARLIVF